jgi:hypothetical protein
MNRKILTTNTGKCLQITLSPFEVTVLQRLAAAANIPAIVAKMKQLNMYTDTQAVGNTIKNFYNLLEK